MAGFKVFILGTLTLGTIGSLWGSSPAVGTATATGPFAVNKAQVFGSTTLFDGALIETGTVPSRLELNTGNQIDLSANSSLTLHGNEAVLEKGSLEARTLRVETEGPNSKAEVRLTEGNMLVKAVTGSVRVLSRTGVLVARVNPGMGVMLDPYAAPPADFDLSGCLLKQIQGTLFGLAVDNQLYQVSGADLLKNKGNKIHITGTSGSTPAGLKGASTLITITKVELVAAGGCRAAGATHGMDGDTGTGGGPGIDKPKSHTTAIIAGVAVAGAGGGIAAALAGGSKSK
jgi:hypothetical protein